MSQAAGTADRNAVGHRAATAQGDGAKSSWNLAPGDIVVPGKTVLRRAGGGERYEVFVAWDPARLVPIIIKAVRPAWIEDRSTLVGLRREASICRLLDHPNIARVLDHQSDGERPYLAMNRIPGRVVSGEVAKRGPLDERHAVRLGTSIASALHYAHLTGVVHMDVKPSNVIVGATPTLIDFSLARTIEKAHALRSEVGTHHSMAPEQVSPPRFGHPGPASDIWGLGATLYFAVTGSRPFPPRASTLRAPLEERYPQLVTAPGALPDTVSPGLRRLIMSCLAFDPAARLSALEVFNAFRELAGEVAMPGDVPSERAAPAPAPSTQRAATRPAAKKATPDDELRKQFSSALRAKKRPRGARRPL